MRPDHAEVIDGLRMDDKELDAILETPNRNAYVQLTQLHRIERHPLRYFLDGSARTFFLGDVVEGDRRSPVNVSQVGAAAVFRHDNGQMRIAGARHRIYLMMDRKSISFSDRIEQLIIAAGPGYAFCDLNEHDGETEVTSPGKEPRSKAAHKAHHLMSRLEEELGRELTRNEGEWLVLDGSLGKDLYRWKEIKNYFGLTKSFSRDPKFSLPGERGRKLRVNLYSLLTGLPNAARTCAFATRGGKMVMWYVRIREQKHLDYPLMGVVKVEYPNLALEPVSSETIDEISRAIIAERQAAPHGRDTRWHAHIYAIYLAEQAVKNGFISTEVLKAGLKWPMEKASATGSMDIA